MQTNARTHTPVSSFLFYSYELIISDFYHQCAVKNFHENIINSELYNFFKCTACL